MRGRIQRRRRGQSLVETAMVLAAVAVVAIPAIAALKGSFERTLREESMAVTVENTMFVDVSGVDGTSPDEPANSSQNL